MANLGRFVHTETGKIIMSILLGLGLASLFREACKGKRCIYFHAPPLEHVKDKTYKFDDKCYKFTPTQTKCNSGKRIVKF